MGLGADLFRQQQVLPQSEQQQAELAAGAEAICAQIGGAACPQTSAALNRMTSSSFTPQDGQSLSRGYLGFWFGLAFASASSIFLMYLVGSFLKSLRQDLQQSLISRPSWVKT